jgi:hypothetical protein
VNATISLFKCAYEELDKAPELKIGGIEDRLEEDERPAGVNAATR